MLLFNSRLRLFPSKLKSKWTSLYLVTQLFPHGVIELEKKDGMKFKEYRRRIKIYLQHAETEKEVVEAYNLDEV